MRLGYFQTKATIQVRCYHYTLTYCLEMKRYVMNDAICRVFSEHEKAINYVN